MYAYLSRVPNSEVVDHELRPSAAPEERFQGKLAMQRNSGLAAKLQDGLSCRSNSILLAPTLAATTCLGLRDA